MDLSADLAAALNTPDLTAFGGIPLSRGPWSFSPGLGRFAAGPAMGSRLLRGGPLGLPDGRRGGCSRPAKPKAKRVTVATLAQDQAALQELVPNMAKQLAALVPPAAGSNSLAQGIAAGACPGAPPGLGPLPGPAATGLAAPLASVLPPPQHVPKSIHHVVPAQSNALVSLVGQLAQGSSEPMLDAPASTSVRGALGRQRLQQNLTSSPHSFSRRIRLNAAQHMNPTGLVDPDFATMVRYLERYGGYGKQRNLAPIGGRAPQPGLHGCLRRPLGPAAAYHRPGEHRPGRYDPGVAPQLAAGPPCDALPGGPSLNLHGYSGLLSACRPEVDNGCGLLPQGGRGHRTEEERGQCPKEANLASQAAPAGRGRGSFEEAAAGCRLGGKASGRSQAVVSDGQKLHAHHPVEGSDLRPGSEFSFRLFASSLVRRVLKSGTGFAHFVSTALPLHRDSSLPVATALFPLPLPSGLASGRSRKRRRTLAQHVSVVVAVVVLALNFLHSEGKPVPPEALRRPPSAVQASALGRLRELVKACARLGGSELQPGRKGLQLAARHAEVLTFLSESGLQDDCYRRSCDPTVTSTRTAWLCLEEGAGISPGTCTQAWFCHSWSPKPCRLLCLSPRPVPRSLVTRPIESWGSFVGGTT